MTNPTQVKEIHCRLVAGTEFGLARHRGAIARSDAIRSDVWMAPKRHPAPLSGGDRKALKKKLPKSGAMTRIGVYENREPLRRAQPYFSSKEASDIVR
jgi:hypothetical protein